ncbi:hypothetical protein ACFQ6B_38380 [Streptomyces wedmorensis]|uniref:Nucleopolyhedrovirus P10 family protein n=1 Tax=Streptomyces wedmorensis TaxID=43759 RepID=A0ABW6J2H9_STRWE
MTTAEGWTAAVRDRLAPGRLLPLGAPEDGAWITERAARTVLDRAASAVRGVVPGGLRVGPDPDAEPEAEQGGEQAAGRPAAPEVPPAPPGSLPSGPLRITADFAAVAGRPLPELAEELRSALLGAAEDGLGIPVAGVDLRVTDLLDTAPPSAGPAAPPPGRTSPATDDPVALAVLRVEGVAGVTDALGHAVRRGPDGSVRIELAVTAGRRPLDVARAARNAATAAAGGATAVTVLVSELR